MCTKLIGKYERRRTCRKHRSRWGENIRKTVKCRACGMRWFTHGLVTCSCIQVTLPSFHSFAYDRSIPSSKASSPQRASSFNFRQPLFSLRSSSSCLRLLSRLPVLSILPAIFPSIMCFRMQFLRKIWPIQLVFLLLIACRIFLSSLTLCNTPFLTRSIQLTVSIVLQHHISKLFSYFQSTLRSVQVSVPHKTMLQM